MAVGDIQGLGQGEIVLCRFIHCMLAPGAVLPSPGFCTSMDSQGPGGGVWAIKYGLGATGGPVRRCRALETGARRRGLRAQNATTKATSSKQRQEMLVHGSSALQPRISVWRASLGGLGGSVWARHVCPGSGPGSFSRRRESWHLPTDRDASEGNCKPTEPCV